MFEIYQVWHTDTSQLYEFGISVIHACPFLQYTFWSWNHVIRLLNVKMLKMTKYGVVYNLDKYIHPGN